LIAFFLKFYFIFVTLFVRLIRKYVNNLFSEYALMYVNGVSFIFEKTTDKINFGSAISFKLRLADVVRYNGRSHIISLFLLATTVMSCRFVTSRRIYFGEFDEQGSFVGA